MVDRSRLLKASRRVDRPESLHRSPKWYVLPGKGFAVLWMIPFIWAAFRRGATDSIAAATLATYGLAMLVPVILIHLRRHCPKLPAATMSVPGAAMSGLLAAVAGRSLAAGGMDPVLVGLEVGDGKRCADCRRAN